LQFNNSEDILSECKTSEAVSRLSKLRHQKKGLETKLQRNTKLMNSPTVLKLKYDQLEKEVYSFSQELKEVNNLIFEWRVYLLVAKLSEKELGWCCKECKGKLVSGRWFGWVEVVSYYTYEDYGGCDCNGSFVSLEYLCINCLLKLDQSYHPSNMDIHGDRWGVACKGDGNPRWLWANEAIGKCGLFGIKFDGGKLATSDTFESLWKQYCEKGGKK
jgi:hypothetical protein